jgi:hypothetical protein
MNINQLKKVLPVAIEKNLNILLKSSPGVGKSESVESIVKSLGYDFMICHPVMEDPIDVKGLPATFENGTKADFIPYGNLRKMMDAEKILVVLIDDVGQAAQSCQAAYMQVIAATNSRKDNAGVGGLITPLLSRFAGIFEIQVDADSWIDWAIQNNMPVELIAYIKNKPAMLSTFNATKEIENFACPRTIANLGKWINAGIEDLEVWNGCVGASFAIEFMAFYQMVKKIGNLPNQIMLDPQNSRIDLTPDLLYFVIVALNNRATDSSKFKTVMQYIERLPLEFQAFAVKLIVGKTPRFMETQEFILWNVKNQGIIQ